MNQTPGAKNIVISGTNFWNPGDDFVREGVIAVLRNLFPGVSLNLFFYNFNADFPSHDKFAGIANTIRIKSIMRSTRSVPQPAGAR